MKHRKAAEWVECCLRTNDSYVVEAAAFEQLLRRTMNRCDVVRFVTSLSASLRNHPRTFPARHSRRAARSGANWRRADGQTDGRYNQRTIESRRDAIASADRVLIPRCLSHHGSLTRSCSLCSRPALGENTPSSSAGRD